MVAQQPRRDTAERDAIEKNALINQAARDAYEAAELTRRGAASATRTVGNAVSSPARPCLAMRLWLQHRERLMQQELVLQKETSRHARQNASRSAFTISGWVANRPCERPG
jgi:hypothetical protein